MNLFTFTPGDLIVSSQINANFREFQNILGEKSSAEELALPGRVTLGPTRRASLSALSDKVGGNPDYLHIGWNAEEYIGGSGIELQRRVAQAGSSAVRVGSNGFSVFVAPQGTSVTNMPAVFAVRANNTAFLHPNWSMTVSRDTPDEISDYRLMFNPLSTPIEILKRSATAASSTFTVNIADISNRLGTTNFHGVEVVVNAVTNRGVFSEVYVHGLDMNEFTGLVLNLGSEQRVSERGCVVFKRGSSGNQKLRIRSTGALSSLTINVVGLWK